MFIKYQTVKIGSQCNFRCVGCDYENDARQALPHEEIKKLLYSIPVGENVEFIGGDPFIRKDVLTIVKIAARRFTRVKFNTNAAGFFYKKLLVDALANGLKILNIKFYSIDPAIHKASTRTDTLQYVVKGMDNLSECVEKYDHSIEKMEAAKFAVIVQIIVNRTTLPGIIETVDYVSRKKFARLMLDCGKTEEINDELLDVIRKSIGISLKNGTWPLALGLPPCALPELEEHAGECYRLERRIPGYRQVPEICGRCEIHGVCAGIPESQVNKWEWKPIENAQPSRKMQDLKNIYANLNWEEQNSGDG
ncbi:MAG: radical SAM protein [bacterium]